MNLEKQIKEFKRGSARFGMLGSAWLFEHLPYGVVSVIMNVLLVVAYQFVIKQKRIARESLQIAFGKEKNSQEIEKIVKQNFRNLGEGMIEMFHYMTRPELIDQNVVFEGRHYLDEALKKGNGVVAVTAHFGNFPLMMLSCAHLGYKTNCIIRPTRDKEVEAFLMQKRTACGLKTIYAIPRNECVRQSLQALRNNEIVFVPLDQNFGSDGGVFVDFFGQKAATATGPVIFAQRTKATILPMFITRNRGDCHTIYIEPPISLDEGRDEDDTILRTTTRITNLIEIYIRRYPHEWGWMHRRWKSRPKENDLVMSPSLPVSQHPQNGTQGRRDTGTLHQ